MTIEQPLFLTDDEMHELTGYKRSAQQIEVLKANAIPYTLTGQEKPRVCRSVIEGARPKKTQTKPQKEWSPTLAKAS
ncbi:MAG: hypothetical protein H6R05_928 [Burkholderiaceae bacterium]|nr:hypothetical protein [Burkholderiaceae bacterium]